jgi:GNAT superfamily N-acetyltransferase
MPSKMYDAVHELSDRYLDDLMTLYRDTWWTGHRTRDDVVEMLRHSSFIVGIVDRSSGQMIGFCRLLTDFVYRGTLYDVICHPAHRNTGVGRAILEALLAHPRIARIEKLALDCKQDKVALYEKFGWSVQDGSHLLHMTRAKTPR